MAAAPEDDDPPTIAADEVDNHLVFVQAALEAADPDERRAALTQGLLHFGGRFFAGLNRFADLARAHGSHDTRWEALLKETVHIATQWLGGRALTGQADESERRARFATETLDQFDLTATLGRLAAECLLALPTGHELRDEDVARRFWLEHLEHVRNDGDHDGFLRAVETGVTHRLDSDERLDALVEEAEHAAEHVDQDRAASFFRIVSSQAMQLAIRAQDGRDPVAHERWTTRSAWALDRARARTGGDDRAAMLVHEALREAALGRNKEAADRLARAGAMTEATSELHRLAAGLEGKLRVGLREFARASELLELYAPSAEREYLSAVEDGDVHTKGVDFYKVIWGLAFSYAHLNRWSDALRALDQGKNLRGRYRAALRRRLNAAALREQEAHVHALRRGASIDVPAPDRARDWIGANLTTGTRVLETYRQHRSSGRQPRIDSSTLSEVASRLQEDECMVVLGLHFTGTLMAVIRPGDTTEPTDHVLLGEWPLSAWTALLAGESHDGWLYALGARELDLDRPEILERLLITLDDVLGKRLAGVLSRTHVRRVHLVPHRWLHLVPFWALPGLADVDVSVWPSAEEFIETAGAFRVTSDSGVLAVANPTGDLPLSAAESDTVAFHLRGAKVPVVQLAHERASETAIAEAVGTTNILHFCGHGRAVPEHPERSALLVHPGPFLARLPGHTSRTDPFETLKPETAEWRDVSSEERCVDLDGVGRLSETRVKSSDTFERRLDDAHGTLWGLYRLDRLEVLAELWTAGDITVQGTLSNCQLAFLSACESASGALEIEVDEQSGLPAALRLAGVGTVIAALWPVSEQLVIVYVELFYRELAKTRRQVDVSSIVRAVSQQVRAMSREDAAALVRTVRSRVSDPFIKYMLEAFVWQLLEGDPLPFRRAYDWASFYVTGKGTIALAPGSIV